VVCVTAGRKKGHLGDDLTVLFSSISEVEIYILRLAVHVRLYYTIIWIDASENVL
jgi:hypothetical protein